MASIPQIPPSLWELGQEAWFSTLALQDRPETFNGFSRGTKTDDSWFPDVVFMEVYPDAPIPIDPKREADVQAWLRIRETLRALVAQKQNPGPKDQALDPSKPIWPLPSVPKLPYKAGSLFHAKRPWSKPQTRWHTGVDIAAPAGMPVLAPEAGTIVAPNSGWESKVVKGQVIGVKALIMQTDSGKTLLLGGIRPGSATVKAGERVVAGQKLAVIGNYPGGSHMLHMNLYEGLLTEAQVNARKKWLKDGPQPKNLIDPMPYLKAAMANTPVVVGAFLIPEANDEIEDGEEDEGTPEGDAATAAAPVDEGTGSPAGTGSSAGSPSSPSSGNSAAIIAGVVVAALLGVAFFGRR